MVVVFSAYHTDHTAQDHSLRILTYINKMGRPREPALSISLIPSMSFSRRDYIMSGVWSHVQGLSYNDVCGSVDSLPV